MLAPLLLTLVTQTPAPTTNQSPPPALLATWKPAKPRDTEYVRYTRTEPDGSASAIFAFAQVCDCQPPHAVELFQQALSSVPGASVTHSELTVCGFHGERVIVTGLADPTNAASNFEVLLFRKEPALYTLQYVFRSAAPMPDAEQALATLCPGTTATT